MKSLTQLEHFAGLAMHAYITADTEWEHDPKTIARWAIENAKALLAEMEKQQ